MAIVDSGLFGLCRTGVTFAICCVVLMGCSKKVEEKTEALSSQIVARVGTQEITTQELDNEFRLANVPVDKRKEPAVVQQVLGELVTRKYMVARALQEKLDREPTVLLDILRAREIVLATAAASRDLTSKASAIAKSDIDKYTTDHPLKFANRQIAIVEQIVLPGTSISQALLDATKDMKSLDEVDQKLTSMGIAHSRSPGALNSGDVSPDFFNLIQAKRIDDIFFSRVGPNGIFFKVKDIETHPLEGDEAANVARQSLRLDLLKSEASSAAVAANLEATYEGNYASIMRQAGLARDSLQGRNRSGELNSLVSMSRQHPQ